MKKRMLRSVLATAFVVALASGAAGPLDVGWGNPTKTEHTSAQDVGWHVVAGANPADVGWFAAGGNASDVGWSIPADAAA
ncbi:5'-nucleotidase [Streptomyces sp. CG1]|uniref:5'-nucleotidase n=1 Tax=Streptomyces sp. CG1 TaxID=1287523 RepID=UPI0034E20DAC